MTNRRRRPDANLEDLVETTKALAHPARLRLLAMLAGGELCVCQMIAVLGLAPSTVSEHLAVLARGGLIAERRAKKFIFYRLQGDGPAARLLPPLLDLLGRDPAAKADRGLTTRLRRVPVSTLCAANLDLEAVGVRRSASPAATQVA